MLPRVSLAPSTYVAEVGLACDRRVPGQQERECGDESNESSLIAMESLHAGDDPRPVWVSGSTGRTRSRLVAPWRPTRL